MIRYTVAFAALMISSSPAFALCTPDQILCVDGETYNSTSGPMVVQSDLNFPGIAVSVPAPKQAVDADGNPVVDGDGNPVYVPQGPFDGIQAQVHGHSSTAVGAGATVGEWVPASDGGTPDDPSDDTPAHWNKVEKGTAVGAGSHVTHNNSTAIGAGAKSTASHQVTLGTEKETVKAPGITSQKSKDRQSGPLEVVTTDANGNLASDGGAIYSRLGSLESINASQTATLNAHSALLSEHSARLDEQAKGLAIAMAMPDAWLSDKKRFGIFGAVGGFEDETALGFAAIGRIDETWSLNAKFGSDTSFDHFGWQIGAGAQW